VETGVFGARMRVEIANEGPVTIVLGQAQSSSSRVSRWGWCLAILETTAFQLFEMGAPRPFFLRGVN
jgi:hypothetical protein